MAAITFRDWTSVNGNKTVAGTATIDKPLVATGQLVVMILLTTNTTTYPTPPTGFTDDLTFDWTTTGSKGRICHRFMDGTESFAFTVDLPTGYYLVQAYSFRDVGPAVWEVPPTVTVSNTAAPDLPAGGSGRLLIGGASNSSSAWAPPASWTEVTEQVWGSGNTLRGTFAWRSTGSADAGDFTPTGSSDGFQWTAALTQADRKNLVPNPSFEVDTTGWQQIDGTSGTLARTTAVATVGSASLSVTATGSVTGAQTSSGTSGIPVTAGLTYSASAAIRHAVADARWVQTYIRWYDSAGNWLSENLGGSVGVGPNFWARYSVTATAPTNAAYASVAVNCYTTVAGDVLYIDAAMLEQASSVGTYFDGDTTDTATARYDWMGTAHASTSTYTHVSAGTATGAFNFTGSGSGTMPLRGSSSGSYALTGTSAGSALHEGAATGSFVFTGSPLGSHVSQGVTSGVADFSGTATGSAPYGGSATGAFILTGSAAGEAPPNLGSSSGAYAFVGSGSGSRASRGSTTGTYDEAGSSLGATPVWKPKNLVATTVSSSRINLAWDALDYATGYDVERDGVVIAYNVATNSYADTGLEPNTSYTYRVRAVGEGATDYLIITGAELAALPTSGTPYTTMLAVADGTYGPVALDDQNSTCAGKTLAGALVYARTGDTTYRDKVVAILDSLPTATQPSGLNAVLQISRQLAGFIICADLIGYSNAAFDTWVLNMRDNTIGTHGRWYSIRRTTWNSGNNWGGWARAARTAASLWLGDTADLADCVHLFKAWLGDRTEWTLGADGDASWPLSNGYFEKTGDFDPTWSHDPTNWLGINPITSSPAGLNGACVEDISRSASGYPTTDDTGRTYMWEVLGGALLTARLLEYNGYPDVWSWSDQALLRAGQFENANGGYPPSFSVNQYIPWMIDKAYGVTVGTVNAASYGRQFGYTDWLS